MSSRVYSQSVGVTVLLLFLLYIARLSNIRITQGSETSIFDCIFEWPQPARAEEDTKRKGGTIKGLWGKEGRWIDYRLFNLCGITLLMKLTWFLTGLSATLLEKENELSKIQKELKLLEPYKVGGFKERYSNSWPFLVHSWLVLIHC